MRIPVTKMVFADNGKFLIRMDKEGWQGIKEEYRKKYGAALITEIEMEEEEYLKVPAMN